MKCLERRASFSTEDSIVLILSRKPDESIVINNEITLTVVAVEGDKVKIGIVAPKEVPVDRLEVDEDKHQRSHPNRPEIERVLKMK